MVMLPLKSQIEKTNLLSYIAIGCASAIILINYIIFYFTRFERLWYMKNQIRLMESLKMSIDIKLKFNTILYCI